MEDSGIDSDSKSILLGSNKQSAANKSERDNIENRDSEITKSQDSIDEEGNGVLVRCKGTYKPVQFHSTSILQKRLEKQILQAKKFRLKEQNLESLPKKLISHSRLNVPKCQVPVVSKADSHPLVSWESDSEEDYHPMSKSSMREISEQLLKDGYNLDLTPDDEDLDLIPPPKPVSQRCICCSLNCTCTIQ